MRMRVCLCVCVCVCMNDENKICGKNRCSNRVEHNSGIAESFSYRSS